MWLKSFMTHKYGANFRQNIVYIEITQNKFGFRIQTVTCKNKDRDRSTSHSACSTTSLDNAGHHQWRYSESYQHDRHMDRCTDGGTICTTCLLHRNEYPVYTWETPTFCHTDFTLAGNSFCDNHQLTWFPDTANCHVCIDSYVTTWGREGDTVFSLRVLVDCKVSTLWLHVQ